DPAAKKAGQRRLIEMMDPQWLAQFDRLSEKYVTMMLEGIVNFRIPVTRLETRWKLSQNRGRREMELIIAELERGGETALAALMRRHLVEEEWLKTAGMVGGIGPESTVDYYRT